MRFGSNNESQSCLEKVQVGKGFSVQEIQLSLTNRVTCLEFSQGHQRWYHSIC